ncbi:MULTISPECIES: GNAT family N-acetyltransferase [Pseudomonas]|uniref:N-acetyltransferase family protein n=1 Tax=Pseudomonas sp. Hg7Tf TaxID=3236988 RepID=A0AB39HXI5_9PSED|nr:MULTISPECIES: GNAT family N-acetyltransferase [Pseudomonas]KJK09114.1 acetyltransferase [Pseudomonas sp. 5]MDD1975595.1 GNAT family N-acetyltransferase [Pseudomonas putida]MDH2560127.1 GNAT family N-acetyltransferase [Pseudomonas sp. Hg5Tf]QYX45920.1 GNAT family N-acetyltransferase [Pseudomonas sp. S11A 273]
MNPGYLNRVTHESLAHYRDGLVALLLDAVRQGASVGFLEDIDAQQANSYFDEVKQRLANGELLLWVVSKDEEVLGSVQLGLCQKPNGLNRAEVQKLLVHSEARRRGLGQQLMQVLELTAQQKKRGLLYLDTEAGSAAEAFYRSQGYTKAGEIPQYACGPDGTYRATALYYKLI